MIDLTIDEKRENYLISAPGCQWELNLEYDRSKPNPYLKSFKFKDNKRTEIRATLREFKADQQIPGERFYLTVPTGAVKLSL